MRKLSDHIVQSVIFDKQKGWTIEDAIGKYLKPNGYVYKKVDETPHFYRFRQYNPEKLAEKGYKGVMTTQHANGVEKVVFYKHKI
jgi:5'(3')-deoxyribonucleotidase